MQEGKTVGTGQDDSLAGTAGDEILMGVAGDDALFGAGGADTLVGGVGDDQLDGGRGDDVLAGGRGSDTFVFRYTDVLASLPPEGETEAFVLLRIGHDVVEDFEPGVDSIAIRPLGDQPPAPDISQFVILSEEDANGDGVLDTVIRVDYVSTFNGVHYTDPGTSITLLGVSGVALEQLLAA